MPGFGEDVVMRGDSVARGKLGYKNSIWVFHVSAFSFHLPLSLSLFVTLPPSCLEIPLPHDHFNLPGCRNSGDSSDSYSDPEDDEVVSGWIDSFAKGASWILWCGFLQVFFGAGSYLIRYIVWAHHVKTRGGWKVLTLGFSLCTPLHFWIGSLMRQVQKMSWHKFEEQNTFWIGMATCNQEWHFAFCFVSQ